VGQHGATFGRVVLCQHGAHVAGRGKPCRRVLRQCAGHRTGHLGRYIRLQLADSRRLGEPLLQHHACEVVIGEGRAPGEALVEDATE
jgi:hypothetical protein